jgi:hypothetical protein
MASREQIKCIRCFLTKEVITDARFIIDGHSVCGECVNKIVDEDSKN